MKQVNVGGWWCEASVQSIGAACALAALLGCGSETVVGQESSPSATRSLGGQRSTPGMGGGGSTGTLGGGSAGGTAGAAGVGDGSAIGIVGQACEAGTRACLGHAQPKTLGCEGGVWIPQSACRSGFNCDTQPGILAGSCERIIPACAKARADQIVCSGTRREACGADLTTTSLVEACTYECSDGVCRTALAVAKAGDGLGTVVSAPAGVKCGTECSFSYAAGSVVTLTATASLGSEFTGWSGGGCTGTVPCSVTLAASTQVTAEFKLLRATLTVATKGPGHGTVNSTPAGISCQGTCSSSFPYGTEVTLNALLKTGSVFKGWSGGSCAGAESCLLTLRAATSVTASFTERCPSCTTIGAGTAASCAVNENSKVVCWGAHGLPPSVSVTQLTLGANHGCALQADASVVCWGEGGGAATPVTGQFTQVSAGDGHNCGIRTDGTVACWGSSTGAAAPTGTFAQVAAGSSNSCGVTTAGAVACWGDNFFGQSTPPVGTFSQVSAGYWNTCGVRGDGALVCWGDNSYGAYSSYSPPLGAFTQTSVGYYGGCAIRTDQTLACWGPFGSDLAPTGTFTQVSVGFDHACGLRTNGTLACWGGHYYPGYGQTVPPEGTFL